MTSNFDVVLGPKSESESIVLAFLKKQDYFQFYGRLHGHLSNVAGLDTLERERDTDIQG